ncbi:MAG: competence protein ComC [Prochlorococcus marinus XMU1425]|nr:competence protein ComC [Prochlorococcus marinus XMU1425]MCR8533568.1 competence protein ComC [Prochlorococcus marinus XMU1426]
MSISKILNSLEKSWERDDILLNIKMGLGTDEIVNEFLMKNERQIKELNSLLRPEDIDLLNQVEKLSTCESKLINEIKNLNYLENNENHQIMNKRNIEPSNRVSFNKISSFLINWSNQIVVIALLTISAIALSKQAWA